MKIEEHTLVAWVGKDELESGGIGIKIEHLPCGLTPLAAMGLRRAQAAKT